MMNRRVSLATAMALVGMQTTKEPTPPTDEEVARELIEQQERAKRKQMEDLDRVLMLAEAYRTALTPMPPGKARRSKRAQRAKARGW